MADYMAKNPGKIRRVKTDKPLRYYPVSLQVGIREHELAAMLDSTLTELKGNGHVARILENYQTDPPSIYLPAVPYRMPVDR
jgi:ABC-type amino acid transport substrate-binding protein